MEEPRRSKACTRYRHSRACPGQCITRATSYYTRGLSQNGYGRVDRQVMQVMHSSCTELEPRPCLIKSQGESYFSLRFYFLLILESFKKQILDVEQVKVSVQCTSHTLHHVPQYTWPGKVQFCKVDISVSIISTLRVPLVFLGSWS